MEPSGFCVQSRENTSVLSTSFVSSYHVMSLYTVDWTTEQCGVVLLYNKK